MESFACERLRRRRKGKPVLRVDEAAGVARFVSIFAACAPDSWLTSAQDERRTYGFNLEIEEDKIAYGCGQPRGRAAAIR
jgi:hypothetical protein